MRSVVISACLAWSVLMVPGDGVAGERAAAPLPVVRLLVVNHTEIQRSMLKAAEDDAATIYRASGVETRWTNVRADEYHDSDVDFIVMIVAGKESRAMAARTKHEVLGFVMPDSTIAFVLFDRVETNAADQHASISRLLGQVIAHEMGHLLLPVNSHSPRGIMQAKMKPRSGLLEFFTAVQAEQIRQRVASLRPAETIHASAATR